MKKRGPAAPVRSGAGSKRRAAGGLEELSFSLGRAYYNYIGVMDRLLAEHELDEYLAPGMGHVLFALYENDDCIIKDIVTRTRLAPSTLTLMLLRMERKGLLERYPDASDGRAMRIRLTELGWSLEPRCRALLRRMRSTLQAGMKADEVATLKRLLGRTTENLHRLAAR